MGSRLVAVAGGLLAAALATAMGPADQASARQPSIYGGTGASGNPGAVALAIWDGSRWLVCSAAMWRPRVILTAAHCLLKQGGTSPVDRIVVYPPGATTQIYSNHDPIGASSAQVRNRWTFPGYAHESTVVSANDIGVLELDADLAPAAYARLATTFELSHWVRERAPAEHVGYGLTGPGQYTAVPMTVSLPIVAYAPRSPKGSVFLTEASAAKGVCPGDSGSPVFRHDDDGTYKLLGIVAGGSGPCIEGSGDEAATLDYFAFDYLSLLNPALASAGYATIPSAPQDVTLLGRNRSVTVGWTAPATSPETVVGYEVLDERGTVVCASATTSCVVDGLPDGSYAYAVRSRNADGEGDAEDITLEPVTIAPPSRLPPPRARARGNGRALVTISTLEGESSAVVTRYVVRTTRGAVACTIVPPPPALDNPLTLACSTSVRRPGTYRFTVRAFTEMGATAASRPSRPVRLR